MTNIANASTGLTAREQELLDMLNGGGWADAPWDRAQDLDDAESFAFRGQLCNLAECHHPVHAFQKPERVARRHVEWFKRDA
ncbi:hypothetical protein [Gordonia sihwensis]|uniref:hypothetical protein n=1 Tax=Gordonia sihwensis TaxID=173559 RepID=UPI003D97B1B7